MKSGIKKLRTISGIIIGVALALTLFFVNLYAAPVTVGNFVVDYVISSDWGTGGTINITLKNNGPAINGWTVGWTFPGNQTITNMWSASYTQSDASVSVKDAGFNASLPTGGSTSFGFNVNYSGTNAAPTSFTVNSSSTTASPTPTSPTPTQQGVTVTPTRNATPTPTPGGVTATPTISSGGPPYQAEDASYGNSAVFENTNGGYKGTGYINFPSSGGYLEFRNVNGGAGGFVTLKFRNALVSSSRTGRIQVNGGTWQNITFDPTGAWTAWTDKQVSVTLNSGTGNTIRLESTGQDLANIDQLDIMTGGSTPTPTIRPATPTATRTVTPTPTVRSTPTPTKAPTATPSSSYNLVVAKDGSGNYATVQAAINAVPDNNKSWFKIYIKNGTYREVITVSSTKTYVWLIGQSNTGTILTYDNCSDTAGGTTNSASFFAKANNFKAENLTFENAFDYNNSSYTNKQAVALEPYADRQTYTNCRITGWQDTLFVRAGRQYFKNCYISGVVDFIFGEGTAVFDQCEVHARNRSSGCFSAPSTKATTTYGLVFLNCALTADSGVPSNSFWLGRPWHPSGDTSVKSAAAYLYCNMGSFVQTNGWTSMSGVEPSTERLREYKNTGAGALINSSRPQLSDSEAANYTVTNLLKGSDNWNPTNY